jgi:hypothetical protein
MEHVGIFYGHLVYISYGHFGVPILWSFGIFFPVLVCCNKKNLATLLMSRVLLKKTGASQGDLIGRIFPYWAFVHCGQLFENYRSSTHFRSDFLLRKKVMYSF